MSPAVARPLIAQFVIAAAICAGVHAVVVAPLRARSDAAQTRLDELIRQCNDTSEAVIQLPELLASHERTRQEAEVIATRSRLALDEAVLFSEVMALSQGSGVTLEQVVPQGDAARPASPSTVETTRPGDRTARYSMTGRGPYAGVVEMVRALERACGYSRLRSCRVTPVYGGSNDATTFTAVIDVHAFDASPIHTLAPDAEQ